jgi:putative transposase
MDQSFQRKDSPDIPGRFKALLRLAGAVLVEAHDEWQVTAERRYLSEASMALLTKKNTEEVAKPELMTA